MSKSKDRGTRWETAIVEYLRARGFPFVERRALAGSLDKGDIAGLPGWVLEAKDCQALTFGPWLNEARQEAANAGAPWYAVIAKRRRSKGSTGSVGDAFAILPFSVLVDLLAHDLPRSEES